MSKQAIVIFSTADWHAPYWTNKQHMALQFAKLGFDVLYVETPGIRRPKLSDARDLSRMIRRVIRAIWSPEWRVSEKITVCSPFSFPWWKESHLVKRINNAMTRYRVGRYLKKATWDHIYAWTYHPYIPETPEATLLVYHCVDDLSAVPGVAKDFANREEKLLDIADVVFVTSETLANKCRKRSTNVHVMPNVVDFEHFASSFEDLFEPQDIKMVPRPRVVYVGALAAFKIDFGLVQKVAVQNPDLHWVLIGDEIEGQKAQEVIALRKMRNVHFLGHKPYFDLPKYLKHVDVATFPTLMNDYTRSMSPMKLFEYLASGLRIVATPLWFGNQAQGAIAVAGDAEQFAYAIRQQLRAGRLTKSEAAMLVGENTWDRRTKNMMSLLLGHEKSDGLVEKK